MLSIILINYNNSNHTINCLKSLFRQNYPKFEIIIVDNNSNIYNRKLIDTFLKNNNFDENFMHKIKIIYNQKNTGFTGGNNLGIKNSKGELILMLNSDTFHDSSFLKSMVYVFKKFKFIHIAQPKICFYPEKDIIWCNGGKINKFSYNLFTAMDYMKKDKKLLKKNPFKIDYAAGTAFFIKKKILEKIGLLDESFFMYCEESDLCYRASQKGYKNIYCIPTIRIYHNILPGFSESYKSFFFRNRMIFCLKNFSILLIIWQFFIQFIQLFFITTNFRKKTIDYRFFFQSLKGIYNGFKIGIKIRVNS